MLPTYRIETGLVAFSGACGSRPKSRLRKFRPMGPTLANSSIGCRKTDWVQENLDAVLEIVERDEDQDGFEVLPRGSRTHVRVA